MKKKIAAYNIAKYIKSRVTQTYRVEEIQLHTSVSGARNSVDQEDIFFMFHLNP